MVSKQIYEPLTNLYAKTQKNSVSKLFSGAIMGLLLWIMVVLVTLVIEAVLAIDEWMGTFIHDIRGFALVAGVILAFEVWGLLPHPAEDVNKD